MLSRWLRSPKDRGVSLEQNTSAAFTLAGVALLASLLVPVGLSMVTSWAWVAGLILVGVGVFAAVSGLLGFYIGVAERASLSATTGVLGGVVAGIAALSLLAMAGYALIVGVILGVELGKPIVVFKTGALLLAGGLTVGYIALGVAGWRAGPDYSTAGQMLVLGGLLLLVPTGGEVLRIVMGIQQPEWVFLPILVLVSLTTVAVGYVTRQSR